MADDYEEIESNFEVSKELVQGVIHQIADSAVGISELIKNSYDADADNVSVNLHKAFESDLRNCVVTVSDDGNGMTLEDINKGWLTIGYSRNKEKKWSDKKGRRLQGGFGLGRFAVGKIGNKLTLVTKSEGGPVYSLDVDWSEFKGAESIGKKKISVRKNSPEHLKKFQGDSTGTYLKISDFDERLSKSDLQSIHRMVQTIVNPFGKEIVDFNPTLLVKEKHSKWGQFDIKNILEQAHFSLECTLNHKGDRLDYVWHDRHPWCDCNPIDTKKEGSWEVAEMLGEPSLLRGGKIWLNYFRRQKGHQELNPILSTGVLSRGDFEDQAGFRLYLGAARVFPYGDTKDKRGDWLGLADKVGAVRHGDWFTQKQIIAAAHFDPDLNPNLEMTRARDGLNLKKREAKQLVAFLLKIVTKMRTELCVPFHSEKPASMAPPSFNYGITQVKDTNEEFFIKPSTHGSLITSFTVDYEIEEDGDNKTVSAPEGLKFNKKNGVFSGSVSEASEHELLITVRGNNKFGSHEDAFRFLIREAVDTPGRTWKECKKPGCERQAVGFDGYCNACRDKTVPVESCDNCDEKIEDCVCGDEEGSRRRALIRRVVAIGRGLEEAAGSDDLGQMKKELEEAKPKIDGLIEDLEKER